MKKKRLRTCWEVEAAWYKKYYRVRNTDDLWKVYTIIRGTTQPAIEQMRKRVGEKRWP